eukprot:gnl/Dysnectes_brevis/99_a119_6375.p1 GENE.gnl/Dysnectes_brevis/99_a119_6375~~gnl/Dysnectes_brevis/99_a119_6375.p1  ORF type:complete len:646 (-),score=276.90 gnl/Dysnectes_brevis/99_a119_6375:54-1991(-)
MNLNLTQKILLNHMVEKPTEVPAPGTPISIRITDTLTQDATGTFAYIEFEAMGIPHIETERSVSYIDHNMMQSDYRNSDDHDYLRSVAAKFGIQLSRPGNGICHQVHLERFSRPGKTLLGSDSHTPTAGGVGQIAIGAGGLSVALAMGGKSFPLKMPKVVGVEIKGKLPPFVAAKDIILELLRRETVRGGKGCVFEYFGEGIKNLSVPERATITNMGAELGATTSIFPSDEVTQEWFEIQERMEDYQAIGADEGCTYERHVVVNLDELIPMVAQPHMPDVVCTVESLQAKKIHVNQVVIGSCTNSSFKDLLTVARMLKGKVIPAGMSLGILPGSRQVLAELIKCGALSDLVNAGARILESGCGPCIGMGFAPRTEAVTVRTFNRNFKGRCGVKSAGAYLVSPETAAACAITGTFTDPRTLGLEPIPAPDYHPTIDDSMIIQPPTDGSTVDIVRGPNIKPCPTLLDVEDLALPVSLKTGDDITTDDIMMAGSKVLPLRSNIPEISKFCFLPVDETFHDRALALGRSVIIGGLNYGQGSSREHAAIAPLHLGVRAVIAKSFARIHADNLAQWGIAPLEFDNVADYEDIKQGDVIEIPHLVEGLAKGGDGVEVINQRTGNKFTVHCTVRGDLLQILRKGGALKAVAQE